MDFPLLTQAQSEQQAKFHSGDKISHNYGIYLCSQHQAPLSWEQLNHQFSLVQLLSSVRLFATPWTAAPTPRACSNSSPLSQWCHQPSHPLSSSSPSTLSLSQHQCLFKWVSVSTYTCTKEHVSFKDFINCYNFELTLRVMSNGLQRTEILPFEHSI